MFRGSVIFDESGFLSEEMMNVYGAFAIVNKSLKTGKDVNGRSIDPIRQRTFATDIPNQKFYISSASSTDTKFYKLYREFAKKQIMGDPDYCVLHIDCELCFSPTLRGEVIAPLLSRSTVEDEMRTNPEKARREYYCQFTTEAGADAIFRRGVITRNEEVRKPELINTTGTGKYILAYDPARSHDNSIVLVMEVYEDELADGSTEYKGKIVSCYNLIDIGKKIKSPMQTPDQVKYLKQLILNYNAGADGYENILGIYIDAGSGGAGVNIADYLMEDWVDDAGLKHRGLIDKEYSAEYVSKFPNAVDKVKLISPAAFKSQMYEEAIELTNQDKVSFTASYDNKGYLTIFDIDEKKLSKIKREYIEDFTKQGLSGEQLDVAVQEKINSASFINTKIEKLSWEEELALANIDSLKEEMVNMVRKKRETGRDSFELTPEKQNKMHDDRSYTYVLACHGLMDMRRAHLIRPKKTDPDELLNKFIIKKPKYK